MLSPKLYLISACALVLLSTLGAKGQNPNKVRNLQLDISTAAGGSTVTGGTGVSSTGVFSLDFGAINGLGLGTPAPGVSVQIFPDGALYTTPIKLTPLVTFNGNTSSSLSVSVMLDPISGTAQGRAATREGATAGSMSIPDSAFPQEFTTSAANNVPITRYVGIFVSNGNGASAVSGSISSRLIYQVTVQ